MVKQRKIWMIIVFSVVALGIVGVIVYQVFFAVLFARIEIVGAPRGNKGDTLKLSNGLAMTLTDIQQEQGNVLLKFSVFNDGSRDIQLISNDKSPHFYMSNQQGFKMVAERTGDAKYPALPTILAAGASASGWVSMEIEQVPGAKQEILYAVETVGARTCRDIKDEKTCKDADALKALIWDFQIATT